MGLFGFGKKKYDKNVTRDNEFLKDYAIKTNGLMLYVEENEKVKKELTALKDDFQYTVATNIRDAKSVEKKIKKDFAPLYQPKILQNKIIFLHRAVMSELKKKKKTANHLMKK